MFGVRLRGEDIELQLDGELKWRREMPQWLVLEEAGC